MQEYQELFRQWKQGQFAPAYLLHGSESFLIQQTLQKLIAAFLPEGSEDFNLVQLDGENAAAAEIAAAANTLPFFGSRRLIIVKQTELFSSSKAEDSELIEYLAQPLASTCLVLTTNKALDRRRKLVKDWSKVGKIIEFSPLKTEDLQKWIAKRAVIKPTVFKLLLDRVGNNLAALEQEILKLQTYSKSREITLEAVQKLTPVPLEENIFKVVENICGRKVRLSFQGLEDLLQLKQPAPVILASLAAEFRKVYQVKIALEQRKSEPQVIQELDLKPFIVRKAKLQPISAEEAKKALLYLQNIDMQIKQGKQDFRAALEEFILDFSCRD